MKQFFLHLCIHKLLRLHFRLERAVKIEPSIQSYHILADAYERTGQADKAGELRARIEKAVASKNPPARSVHQVRKVQM